MKSEGMPMEENAALADMCTNFYSHSGEERGQGQIIYCPVSFQDRRPLVADITRSDGVRHSTAEFNIRKLDESQDFRGKDRLPVAALSNLQKNDEAIISIAKMRPCLILGAACEFDPNLLPSGWQRSKALNAFDKQFILAPIYSISSNHYPGAFGPILTSRIKAAMYSEFFFLPQMEPVLKHSSIIRFDRIFLSPLTSGIRLRDLWLEEEPLSFALQQLYWMLGAEPAQEFLEIRELLLEDLPEEAK